MDANGGMRTLRAGTNGFTCMFIRGDECELDLRMKQQDTEQLSAAIP